MTKVSREAEDANLVLRALSVKETPEDAMFNFLSSMGLDMEDQNLAGTPARVTKMYRNELLAGYSAEPPNMTSFPTPDVGNQLVITPGINVDSMCAHHLMPISGHAAVGAYFLEDSDGATELPGLSKYARVVDHYSRRLQLQEALTMQIAKHVLENTKAVWVGVHIKAEHYCMKHRGVKLHDSSTATTSFIRRKVETALGPKHQHHVNYEGYFVSFDRAEELKRSFLEEVFRT